MMSAHLENGENVTDRPPVDTKTVPFLPADFETVDFENGRF